MDIRWLLLISFIGLGLAYDDVSSKEEIVTEELTEEIENSHVPVKSDKKAKKVKSDKKSKKPAEEHGSNENSHHEADMHPDLPPPHIMGFPGFLPPMHFPQWMKFWQPRHPMLPPPVLPKRYLKEMKDEELDDDELVEAAHVRANALAQAEAHARAEAYALAESSARKHRRRRSQRKNPKLVDSFSIVHPEEFWQDVDGGMFNPVTAELLKKPGFATKEAIKYQLDHFAFPLHLGEIHTGRLANPELSAPGDRAFGEGFDFFEEDLRNSFEFRPHGGRPRSTKEFTDLIRKGYQPRGKLYILHKQAFTSKSVCRTLVNGHRNDGYAYNFGSWEEVSCMEMNVPGLYRLVRVARREGNRHHRGSGGLCFYLRELGHPGRNWAVCNLNVMGLQAKSPTQEKLHKLHPNSNAYYTPNTYANRPNHQQHFSYGNHFGYPHREPAYGHGGHGGYYSSGAMNDAMDMPMDDTTDEIPPKDG